MPLPDCLLKSRRWLAGTAVIASLVANPATAMLYAPIDDRSLLDMATLVIEVDVIEPPVYLNGQSVYTVYINETLKGEGVGNLRISVPGTSSSDSGEDVRVPGAPRLEAAGRKLLFLKPRADGTHVIVQMSLGVFHAHHSETSGLLALQDLRGAASILPGASETRWRDYEKFKQWIRSEASARPSVRDYWLENAGFDGQRAKFEFSSEPPYRWPDFEEGRPVLIGINSRLLPATAIQEEALRAALAAWNTAPGALIRLEYGGQTPAFASLSSADGINAVHFADPLDEIVGPFNCLLGGVLAYSSLRSGATQWSGNDAFRPLREVDIVIQDGADCTLSRWNHANTAEILAHEVGHALGLAHSCGERDTPPCTNDSAAGEALMRPTLHSDGRGAQLGSDDIAGVKALYPDPNATPGPGSPGAGDGGGGALTGTTWLLGLLLLRSRHPRRKP